MVNRKIWGIFLILALAFMLQEVSAKQQVYVSGSSNAVYWYNPNTDYGGTQITLGDNVYAPADVWYTNTQRYSPGYNNYGNQRYSGYSNNNYYRKDGKWYLDRPSSRAERQKIKAVKWVLDSYNARYKLNDGKTSGEAFYYDIPQAGENVQGSNFRNKPAYDPLFDGVDPKNNYYYKPQVDSSGAANWRF